MTYHADGYLTIHEIVAEAFRETPDEKTFKATLKALFEHFVAWIRSFGCGS